MKNFKNKILSGVIALCLILSIAFPVFATNGETPTIDDLQDFKGFPVYSENANNSGNTRAITAGNYLALGDSIPAGFALNDQPNENFVSLIGARSGITANNQGISGQTSTALHNAVVTNNTYDTQIDSAEYITITIGGNDLMAVLYTLVAAEYNDNNDPDISAVDVPGIIGNSSDTRFNSVFMALNTVIAAEYNAQTTKAAFETAFANVKTNIQSVIGHIREINPGAKIYVTNQYNPYKGISIPFLGGDVGAFFEAGLTDANGFNATLTELTDCNIVDIYTAFDTSTDTVVNATPSNFDFHPNAAGHELYKDTLSAINQSLHTVTFDVNDGNALTPASVMADGNNKLPSLPTPTRDGHTFDGWYTDTTWATQVDTNYVFTQSTTIFAKWTAHTYSIDLSQTETLVFPQEDFGYAEIAAQTITVNNTGNQPTGALTVALSGGAADRFTVSTNSIDTITSGSSDTFTLRPNTALDSGNYSATVTVSGANGITQSFDVTFAVRNEGYDRFDLSQKTQYVFPQAIEGYGDQSALSVTVSNIGSIVTGDLTIAIGSDNSEAFSVNKNSISSIGVDSSDSFTITPNKGLTPGLYVGTISVENTDGVKKFVHVQFTVIATSYSIFLDPSTTINFATAREGYNAQTPQTITVKNTGNMPTGELNIALSGVDAASFQLIKSVIDSIPVGGSDTFTLVPIQGLGINVYIASITVSGANGISFNKSVNFEVESAIEYGINITPNTDYVFRDKIQGDLVADYTNITVFNSGRYDTGALTIALGNGDSSGFSVDKDSINNLAPNSSESFRLSPKINLDPGTYTDTVTVSGANVGTKTVNVSFTVIDAVYSIAFDPSTNKDFGTAMVGYGAQSAHNVTVTNTGNAYTGDLSITLSGGNASSFELDKTQMGLGAGDSNSFSVTPKTGLSYGTYTETVTVSNPANGISQSFDVSFTVNGPWIVEGANLEVVKGQNARFVSNEDYEGYTDSVITIDGVPITIHEKGKDNENASAKDGSIVLTLSAQYTSTLPIGTHTIAINSANGSATTTFTVVAQADPLAPPTTAGGEGGSPSTGDNSIALWLTLIMGIALMGAVLVRRKAIKNK